MDGGDLYGCEYDNIFEGDNHSTRLSEAACASATG